MATRNYEGKKIELNETIKTIDSLSIEEALQININNKGLIDFYNGNLNNCEINCQHKLRTFKYICQYLFLEMPLCLNHIFHYHFNLSASGHSVSIPRERINS